jgi:hypothetical protein
MYEVRPRVRDQIEHQAHFLDSETLMTGKLVVRIYRHIYERLTIAAGRDYERYFPKIDSVAVQLDLRWLI